MAIKLFANARCRSDPESAFQWLEGLQPEDRKAGLDALGTYWAFSDPWKAADFAAQLPDDALLKNIVAADPDGAAAWAETISDAALRESWKSRLQE